MNAIIRRITMPSEDEILFHRSFLGRTMALAIWNEDYTYQNTRGGPPGRQKKRESDPVYAYHVHQGPHYPAKPPGDGPDKRYNAFLARNDGSFEPLVIITKRGLTGQNFPIAATPWELKNSVLCGALKFTPVVNAMMEVTGHYANVQDTQLIRPAGISFTKPEECIANEVQLYLWINEFKVEHRYGTAVANRPAPEGWESFKNYGGGIDVLVLPNGEVIGAKGRPFQSNNGTTYSVMSPLDFWSPGSRLLAGGIRVLTNRIAAGAVKALKVMLTIPSKELALLSVARLSGTLPGVAVSTRGVLAMEHLGRRTFIMGEDLARFRGLMAQAQTEAGFYDLVIHGDSTSFQVLIKVNGKEVWRNVSVREVAAAIGPKLAPGDKLRLLACDVGTTGGPAQQLANELNRTVWGASTKVPAVPKGAGVRKAFVPIQGGKFHEFLPERGLAKLSGNGGKVTGNEVQGVINKSR
jgi:hypothetical protein